MNEPLISVITVCYNAAAYIEETVRSVLGQQYPHVEYIVIDGASTDGTQKILTEYAHKISRTISEPDQGIYDAMNKGILNSTGQFIIFLNAGDTFTSHYSLASVARSISERNADIYFGKIVWVDTVNRHVHTTNHNHIQFEAQLYYENFPHPATIYRRDAFDRYGLFKLQYKVYADYEWNLDALLNHSASFYFFDNIVTTFYSGGISNNAMLLDDKRKEKENVLSNYFTAPPTKPKTIGNKYYMQLFNKVFAKRLNRIF